MKLSARVTFVGRITFSVFVVARLCSPANAQMGRSWTGAATPDANWMTAHNWLSDAPPASGDNVVFDVNSTQNLATVNDFTGLSVNGIVVGAVPSSSPVSIGGNSFTLGAGGIDMSAGGLSQAL